MPDVFVNEDLQSNSVHKPESAEVVTDTQQGNLPFLAAFCQNPNGVKFKNQEPDEKIILFLRRHLIKNLNWISLSILLMMLPVFIFYPFNLFENIQSIIPIEFLFIFIAFYFLIVTGYAFVSFITWFYNVGIITNKQIIDIDFTDIMYREVAKVRIDDIIDVEFTQGGFFHSIADYGNVFIQTEGVKPNFEFHSIPKPDKTTDIILDLKGPGNNG